MILVVDDDLEVRTSLKRVLELSGYQVITASGGRKAREVLDKQAIDIVITDLIMEDMDGLSLIRSLRSLQGAPSVIAISGGGRGSATSYLSAAQKLGACATFTKPVAISALLQTLQQLSSVDHNPIS